MKLISLILLLALPCLAQSPNCLPAPPGLVGWWKGEGNALDSVGANDGVLTNGAGFAPGEGGQAFSFTGPYACVQIADAPALDPTNSLSLEAWVLLSSYPANDAVIAVSKTAFNPQDQYDIDVNQSGGHSYFRATLGIVPTGDVIIYGTTPLQTNTWYHVAITYDGAQFRLYVNGQVESSVAVTGAAVRTTGSLKFAGYGFGPWTLPGRVDEVSLYNRALSTAEIRAIYMAGSAGKCFTPVISSQPQGQVGYWGATVTFSVQARGSAPLSYLWYKDGVPITWATNSSLVLTNLSLDEGGTYYVVVTNPYGSVFSSSALLTVNPVGVSLGIYPGLTVQGTPGRTFGIQYTTNVAPNSTWLTLTQFTLVQPIQMWFDADNNIGIGNNPRRYYRVVALP